jgi:hypothetical protein
MLCSPKLLAHALPGLVSAALVALAAQPVGAVDVRRSAVISAPYEVAQALRALGMRPLASPWQRGMYWVAPAVDRDGTSVRVVVERGSGRVVNVREVEAGPPRPRVGVAPLPGAPGPRVVMRDGTLADPRAPRRGAWADLEDEEETPPPTRRPYPPQGWTPPSSGPIPPQTLTTPPGQPRTRGIDPGPRIATRPAEPKPRGTPLPKPRPAEIATVPMRPAPVPAAPTVVEAKPATPSAAPARTPDAFPPAQGFE